MTDTRSDTPISIPSLPLPPGGFEIGKLRTLEAELVELPEEERDAHVMQRIPQLRGGDFTRHGDDPSAQEDFTFRKLTRTIGDEKVTEDVRVFTPPAEETKEDPIDVAAFVARNVDDISDADLAALSKEQLGAVREAEVAGKNRTTLVARIDAAIEAKGNDA